MKKTFLIVIACLLFIGNAISQKNPSQGLSQITPELLKKYIYFLASDSLKGRNTPSRELDIAADYISKEFASMGVKPVNGTYFQNISFCSKNLDVDKSFLKISIGDNSKSFNLKTDFTPFEMTANAAVESSIVFAGYGITATEYNYDDYKDIDVKGKIVLVMKHEPGEKDAKSPFDGASDTKYSAINYKLENAKKHGATGVIVVTDPLNHIMLTPQGYPWPSLSKFLPQDNLPIELCSTDENAVPFAQVGESVIKFLFGSVDTLKNIQKRIDKLVKPASYELASTKCELATILKVKEYIAKNVVGYIEGRDKNLKNELVIIGGHYDHVGAMSRHKEGEDYIFNGADDNASGTAGTMAVAKAFTSMKVKPKRSILFILFAGEEKGLYGSNYYVEHPLFPLDKSVAMLNMDMIGRNGNDTLQIDGFQFNPDLAKIMLKEAKNFGLKQSESKEYLFERSDHYNFFKHGITAVDISSGLHKDYHTVRDNPETINPLKAALISKLTFKTAWIMANEKKHYKILPLKRNK